MNTETNTLDDFGDKFMTQVRDRVLQTIRHMIQCSSANAVESSRLRKASGRIGPNGNDAVMYIATVAVDLVLHTILTQVLDCSDNVKLIYTDGNETIEPSVASESLNHELFGEHGWIERYSKFPRSIAEAGEADPWVGLDRL